MIRSLFFSPGKSIRNTKVQTTPEIERLKVIRDEKKAILDEVESLNRHGDTLQELKDIADETGDTTITKKTVDDGLVKDLIQAHIEKGTPVASRICRGVASGKSVS